MMKKLVILFISAILSTQVLADTVRLNPDIDDLPINGVTDTTYLLSTDEPSGDATSETAPARVYVPMQSGVTDQADYFLLKGVNNTFNYLFDNTNISHVINFPLYLNVSTTDKYLYAAVKDGTTYRLARAYGGVLNNITNGNYIFPVSPNEICAQMTTTTCASLSPASTTSYERADLIYFFLSTVTSIAVGDTVDVTANTGGIYFEVNMSNRVYPSLAITVTQARPGDRRAVLEYTGSTTILKPDHVRIFDTGGVAGSMLPIGQLTGTLLAQEYVYAQTSSVTVINLVNDQTYNLGVMYVDKYNFASMVSATKEATPQEIEELLKKNACFLLTAGFGEDHYVIDYFRHFRDTVLSQSYLGRSFIHVYYELAPKYALIIYQHEGIRAAIRGAAYVLYFVFNFYYLFVTAMIVGTLVFIYRKRDKIRQVL